MGRSGSDRSLSPSLIVAPQTVQPFLTALEDVECYRLRVKADIATLYGEHFAEVVNQRSLSAFIADGSPTVRRRVVVVRRLRQTPKELAIAWSVVAAAQTVKSRHAGNNRFRSAYRSGALLETRVSLRSFFRFQASPVVLV